MKQSPLRRYTPLRRTPMSPRRTRLRRSNARLGVRRPPMSPAEKDARDLVNKRSRGVCEACGEERAGEWHHRKRRSQGGTWSACNGMHVGARCHLWITGNPNSAGVLGWHLESHQDPAAEPLRRRGDWVVFSEDGLIGFARPPERATDLLRVAENGAHDRDQERGLVTWPALSERSEIG